MYLTHSGWYAGLFYYSEHGIMEIANDRKWTATQYKFIEFLSLPRELRDERNETEFIKKHHLSPNTLVKWKRMPGFWDEVQAYTEKYLKDTIPAGVESLKEMVRRGSFNHQKMYFEMTGMYTPKSETKLTGEIKQHITEYEYTDDDSSPEDE